MTTPFTPHGASNGSHPVDATSPDPLAQARLAASRALDSLTETLHVLREATGPLVEAGAERAEDLAQDGLHAWRRRSRQVRLELRHTRDRTVHRIQDEPLKSVLLAAAGGAAVMALAAWLMSATRHRR